jgi:hypothetical protein
MFAGVNRFPDFLSKSLEFQNGEWSRIFRCDAKYMNHLLSNGSMFPLRACLNLFVQTIRQILDIQGRHTFLQNSSIMEETTRTVKFSEPIRTRTMAKQLPMFGLVII